MKNSFRVLLLILFFSPLSQGFSQIDSVFKVLTASQVDNGVLINFTIRGGVTCSGVKIQKSADGIFFEDIFEFVGVCGAISTDESYTYTDTKPIINSTSYYRLDLGTLHLYSEVITVRYIDYNSGAVIFPNPCRNNCTIYFSNKSNNTHEIKLFDRTGSNIMNEFTKMDFWEVPASTLPTGYYYFIIYRDGEERHTGNVVIL